jgi:hypothetical protein
MGNPNKRTRSSYFSPPRLLQDFNAPRAPDSSAQFRSRWDTRVRGPAGTRTSRRSEPGSARTTGSEDSSGGTRKGSGPTDEDGEASPFSRVPVPPPAGTSRSRADSNAVLERRCRRDCRSIVRSPGSPGCARSADDKRTGAAFRPRRGGTPPPAARPEERSRRRRSANGCTPSSPSDISPCSGDSGPGRPPQAGRRRSSRGPTRNTRTRFPHPSSRDMIPPGGFLDNLIPPKRLRDRPLPEGIPVRARSRRSPTCGRGDSRGRTR